MRNDRSHSFHFTSHLTHYCTSESNRYPTGLRRSRISFG
nr:MAG TPA: hypothetical protein [Caudoviricetes sp.]